LSSVGHRPTSNAVAFSLPSNDNASKSSILQTESVYKSHEMDSYPNSITVDNESPSVSTKLVARMCASHARPPSPQSLQSGTSFITALHGRESYNSVMSVNDSKSNTISNHRDEIFPNESASVFHYESSSPLNNNTLQENSSRSRNVMLKKCCKENHGSVRGKTRKGKHNARVVVNTKNGCDVYDPNLWKQFFDSSQHNGMRITHSVEAVENEKIGQTDGMSTRGDEFSFLGVRSVEEKLDGISVRVDECFDRIRKLERLVEASL
jgi:hypothetical protein